MPYLQLPYNLSQPFQSPSFRGGSTPEAAFVRRNCLATSVSIPFVSGREHSPGEVYVGAVPERPFQSPSFRGGSTPIITLVIAISNPGTFQSPSFRGGSTPPEGCRHDSHVGPVVSIPFVSGREHSRYAGNDHGSWGGSMVSIPFVSGREHSRFFVSMVAIAICGAVSIPFVSGREHSRGVRAAYDRPVYGFQSPSFRGGSTPLHAVLPESIRPHRFNPLRFGAGALP